MHARVVRLTPTAAADGAVLILPNSGQIIALDAEAATLAEGVIARGDRVDVPDRDVATVEQIRRWIEEDREAQPGWLSQPLGPLAAAPFCAVPRQHTASGRPPIGLSLLERGQTVLRWTAPATLEAPRSASAARMTDRRRWLAPIAMMAAGEPLFHGATVRRADGSVRLVLGASGAGKSTIAEAWRTTTGRDPIGDDAVWLATFEGPVTIHPTAAEAIRVWPTIPVTLGAPPPESMPVAEVALLAADRRAATDRITADDVPPAEAFAEIIRHSFAESRLPIATAAAIDATAALVRHATVVRWTVPNRVAALPAALAELDAADRG